MFRFSSYTLLVALCASAPSVMAQGTDPLMGLVDAATTSRIQQALSAANASAPTQALPRAPGRVTTARISPPNTVTLPELTEALDFIDHALARSYAFAVSRLRGRGVPLHRIENALAWITLSMMEEELARPEAALSRTHAGELLQARRALEDQLRLMRSTPAELLTFRGRLSGRRSTSDRIFELWTAQQPPTPGPQNIIIRVP